MNIGLAGFGNVGKAFTDIVKNNQKNKDIHMLFILDSTGGALCENGLDLEEIFEKGLKNSKDYLDRLTLEIALKTCNIDYFAELTPTNKETGEPGLSNIESALSKGIHTVTGNKGPIMLKYQQLKALAQSKNVSLGIGCTAGGALPTINAGIYDFSGGRIQSFEAILNGTSNFVLSQMTEEHLSFEEALKNAQKLGIAEADPTYDIGGFDTALKTIIIANCITGSDLKLADTKVSGIDAITMNEIHAAMEKGCKIKLTGRCTIHETGTVTVETGPRVMDPSNPLYHIDGKDKGIYYKSDIFGDLFISGGSSDPYSSGAAIFRDIMNIEKGYGY